MSPQHERLDRPSIARVISPPSLPLEMDHNPPAANRLTGQRIRIANADTNAGRV